MMSSIAAVAATALAERDDPVVAAPVVWVCSQPRDTWPALWLPR
jgi:hypothetical protein